MENSLDTRFPEAFGASPDDFLNRYESLIYKVIYERTREEPRFEAADLFNDFFIHIAEEDFKRLRCYRGECQPTTYLGKILRNFICDRYRRKEVKVSMESLERMVEEQREPIPASPSCLEDIMSAGRIREAFQETFARVSNREKMIFDLSMEEEMTAGQIADLLGMKAKSVYKTNEKIKKILRDELKKRGIEHF